MNRANGNESGVKRARLLGGVGAVALGVGLGALFASFLKPYALPVLLTGVAMHALGMFIEHRLENKSANAPVWWAEILYWVCWVLLLGVIIFIAVDYLKG